VVQGMVKEQVFPSKGASELLCDIVCLCAWVGGILEDYSFCEQITAFPLDGFHHMH
jgi:hypothetical protein